MAGVFVGAGVSGLVSYLLGRVVFRLRGPYFALATLALGEIFFLLSNHFEKFTGGSVGLVLPRESSLYAMSFLNKKVYGFLALGFMLVTMIVSIRIKNSKRGYFFYALKDEEESAKALGVPVLNYKLLAFIISAVFTSFGGAFYVCYLHYADPEVLFSIHHSVQFAMMAIIGGAGTVAGPIDGFDLDHAPGCLAKKLVGGTDGRARFCGLWNFADPHCVIHAEWNRGLDYQSFSKIPNRSEKAISGRRGSRSKKKRIFQRRSDGNRFDSESSGGTKIVWGFNGPKRYQL